jgi:cytochrome d ubiquinol oxidase subunit I
MLLTRDAVTTTGDIWLLLGVTLVIYAGIGTATVLVLRSMRNRWRLSGEDLAVPYGPDAPLEEAVPEKVPT